MNTRICAAVLAVVALTAGCAGEPAAAPPASTATTTTTTVPPSPAELNERAKAAIAPPGAFDSLGGAVKVSNPANDGDAGLEGEAVTTVCNGGALRADDVSIARTRVWTGRVDLFQRVHAIADRPAAGIMAAVRTRVDACAGRRPADQLKANLPLAKPAGVDDFYAYCETNNDPQLVAWSCHALMGRGTLISLVVAFSDTQGGAELQLATVVPIFAESFAKA